MTLALGIDPGTATTGFGLVRLEPDGSLAAIKYGVILTPKEASAPARLEMLYNDLSALLREHHPDTAAVEKLFFSRNVTTALAVGQARGVVMLCMQQAGV
jgi:crossover junction endodeoxyribonuclease RuvC